MATDIGRTEADRLAPASAIRVYRREQTAATALSGGAQV